MWARLRRGFESARRDPVTVDVLVDPGVARDFRSVVRSQLVTGTEVEVLGPAEGGPAEGGPAEGVERWRLQLRARLLAVAVALAWAPGVRVVAPDELVAAVRRQAGTAARTYSD